MVTLGPFTKGMNNRAADYALPKGSVQDPGDAVRNAVNADFDNQGRGRRRAGFTKVYSSLLARDSYSCPAGVFFIEDNKLKIFNPNNTSTFLCSSFGPTPAYDYLNGTVYFTDGAVCRKIINGSVLNWGMTRPEAPALYSTSGVLPGGRYIGAASYVDADGVESGASEFVEIDVSDNASIIFSGLQIPIDPQVVSLRLYLSTANGSELYRVATISTTATSYSVTLNSYTNNNILALHFVGPPPPGRIIKHHNGRIFIADAVGNVWYTEPFQYDHFQLGRNFIQFPQPVDIMEPVDGGIFFAYGNTTEFYAGDVGDGFDVQARFNYGGIYGTSCVLPNSSSVCWQSQRGMVVGGGDGALSNQVEDRVATDTGTSGAALVREQNGIKQFIACIKNPTISTLSAKSFIESEIIRRQS